MGLRFEDLLPTFKASLNDAASVFTAPEDVDFKRHLVLAADALSRCKRPRTVAAEFTVVAYQAEYEGVPADLIVPKVGLWNAESNRISPWNLPPGPMPVLTVIGEGDGRRFLLLPPPSAAQIACFGSTYRYYYLALHAITDDASTSTLAEKDRALLYLRAQVEAMKELSLRAYKKPVTLRAGDGLAAPGGISRNQTPAALYGALLALFESST